MFNFSEQVLQLVDELVSLNAKLSAPQSALEAKSHLGTAAEGGTQLTARQAHSPPPPPPPPPGSIHQLETAPYTPAKPNSGVFFGPDATQRGPYTEQAELDARAAVDSALRKQRAEAERQSGADRLTGALPLNLPSSASLELNPASVDTTATRVEQAVRSERKVPEPLHQKRKVPDPLRQETQTRQPGSDVVARGLEIGPAAWQLQQQPPADWASKPIGRSSSVFKVFPS